MDIVDVATLDDDAFESTATWMGCILCPYLGAGCEEDTVNLLEKGKMVVFHKRKNGDGQAPSYSRKSSHGIRLPTQFSACPEHWQDVSAEVALWAWNGRSIVGSRKSKSKEKGNILDKVMQCNRCRPYKSKSPQQAFPLPPPCPRSILF